jgi:predicted transcriptional regulator
MRHIWNGGPATVHDVRDALNSHDRTNQLAYTTILTVMRNLTRRGMLTQARGGRSHIFAANETEAIYKWSVLEQVSVALFADDLDAVRAFIMTASGKHAPMRSARLCSRVAEEPVESIRMPSHHCTATGPRVQTIAVRRPH